MVAENTARMQRGRGRPFRKGTSGNPAGRPSGVRNRATILLEAIADEDLNAIATKVVAMAKAGDLTAAKLIFDRVAPAPAARAIATNLSPIGKWDGTDAVLNSYRTIIHAVAGGEVSPAEGLELISLIEAQRTVVKELRPEAMYREPTPAERAEQKRINEKIAKKFKPLWED
jgi:hypothetical protein